MNYGHQVGRAVNMAAKLEPLSDYGSECKFVANNHAIGLFEGRYVTRKLGL